MEFIIKISKCFLLRCYLIIMLAVIPTTSFAQEIVDTAPPGALLAVPTIVAEPSPIELDCRSYTGCGVIVVKKYTHQYKPKHPKKTKRHHKPKQYYEYESCCGYVNQCCNMRPW